MIEGIDYRISGDLTETDRVMSNTLWVGVYPGLTEEHISVMINTFKSAFSR